MSNKDLFNQKEFPIWKGHNTTYEKIKSIKELWLDDKDHMAKSIHELILEKIYLKDMLLYIQRKLYLDEPLMLCLNSAKEVFDIMITPCEVLNNKGKELTLDDYDDIEEWTIEHEDEDDPESKQYMLCKTCDFATKDTFKFAEHKCYTKLVIRQIKHEK